MPAGAGSDILTGDIVLLAQDSSEEIESSGGGIGRIERGVDGSRGVGTQVNELNSATGAGLLAGCLRGAAIAAGCIESLNAVRALDRKSVV